MAGDGICKVTVESSNECDGSNVVTDLPPPRRLNRYQQIMERIFFWYYKDGAREVVFEREDMVRAAQELGIDLAIN